MSAPETILPIGEIEQLLISRNAATGTKLYRFDIYPELRSDLHSTITFLSAREHCEVTIYTHDRPETIDHAIAVYLMYDWEWHFRDHDYPKVRDQPLFMAEQERIPVDLARHCNQEFIERLDVFNFPPIPDMVMLDGVRYRADLMSLNVKKLALSGNSPDENHRQFFWHMVYLGLRCMESKRSVKTLIALLRMI